MKLFRQMLEKWHTVKSIHPLRKAYSSYEPVYQASLLSVTESLLCNTYAHDHIGICCGNTCFKKSISFFRVIDVTAANDLCLSGNGHQNVFKGYHGMAI